MKINLVLSNECYTFTSSNKATLKNVSIMRTATNYTTSNTGTYGWGKNEKKYVGSTHVVAIDNYGTVTSQAFINRLIENNRIHYSYYKKRTCVFTDEFLTKMLNENIDLFPVQF